MKVPLKMGLNSAPVDPDARIHIQHARNVVGTFYEALGAWMLDAEPWKGGTVYAHRGDEAIEQGSRYRRGSDTPLGLTPDLLWRPEGAFVEVKGGNDKSVFLPYVWQSELYGRIHRSAQEPIYRPRVYYLFFMHSVNKITKNYASTRKLVEALTRNTLVAFLLDLDVVLGFRDWCGVREYGSMEPGRHYYPPFYRLTPRHLRALRETPRDCLDSILGRKQVHFSVTTKTVGSTLLDPVRVWDSPLAPFTLVTIRRMDRSPRRYDGPNDTSWYTYTHQEEIFEPQRDPWAPSSSTTDDEAPF